MFNFPNRDLVGKVDRGLVRPFSALAFPVHTMGSVIPTVVALGALNGHVDDLVDDLLGLNDDMRVGSGRVIKTECTTDINDPLCAFLRVLSTKLPLIIFLVVNVEATGIWSWALIKLTMALKLRIYVLGAEYAANGDGSKDSHRVLAALI